MASWECRHKIPYQPVSSNGDPDSATPALFQMAQKLTGGRTLRVTKLSQRGSHVTRPSHTHTPTPTVLVASAKELLAPARELARANCTNGKTDRVHTPRGAQPHLTALGWRMETRSNSREKSCCAATLGATGRNMERELWPGLVRWVGASETTNRGVAQATFPTTRTGAPGYYPTAPQRKTKSQDSPRLATTRDAVN